MEGVCLKGGGSQATARTVDVVNSKGGVCTQTPEGSPGFEVILPLLRVQDIDLPVRREGDPGLPAVVRDRDRVQHLVDGCRDGLLQPCGRQAPGEAVAEAALQVFEDGEDEGVEFILPHPAGLVDAGVEEAGEVGVLVCHVEDGGEVHDDGEGRGGGWHGGELEREGIKGGGYAFARIVSLSPEANASIESKSLNPARTTFRRSMSG